MSYELAFKSYMKVYAPLSFVVDRTWRSVTGGTTPWDLPQSGFWKRYHPSPSGVHDWERLATPTTSTAVRTLVDGTALGFVVPMFIALLGLLMCLSSILVFVGRLDKAQGRNPALRRKSWIDGTLKALGAAAILTGDILNLDGSFFVQSIVLGAYNQLLRLRKTTGGRWILRALLTLGAAAVLVTILRLAFVPILVIVPFLQTVYAFPGLLLRPVIYLARMVFACRQTVVDLVVFIVRLVTAYYPTVFWFAVSAVRRLLALAKLSSALFVTLILRR